MLVGPAALSLFCLAPHGVFRASRITPRAVSSYLAISPLPVLENNSCCFKEPAVSFLRHFPSTPTCIGAARVFYAACCRMVFGLSSSESRRSGTHQRSSAIARILHIAWHSAWFSTSGGVSSAELKWGGLETAPPWRLRR